MWTYTFDRKQMETLRSTPMPGLDNIEFSRSQDGQYRPYHSHPECHILFCTSGEGFLRLNDVEVSLTPGVLAVIKPGVLHSCGAREEGMEFWGLSIYPSGAEDELTRQFCTAPALAADFSGYLNYVTGAFLFLHDLAGREHLMDAGLQAMRAQTQSLLHLSALMLDEHPLPVKRPQELPMQAVMRWIIDHYTEDISLDKLARQFAMSSSHLSRSFFQSFQVSPINYLIDYRLNAAKDLLIYTDTPIGEVARSVGYDNVYHFSNLFSKRIGYTPQTFRQHCRKEETQPIPVTFASDPDFEDVSVPAAGLRKEASGSQSGTAGLQTDAAVLKGDATAPQEHTPAPAPGTPPETE